MSSDEQDRTSGSVPNAFGNALAWNWMPKMPASLKRSNLHTLLYTLRAIANADGTLRYRDTKRPFSLQAIAKAAGADQKDARDRMEAAIRAGVVTAVGERRKGRSVLYVIVPAPAPNWAAAAAYLDGVKTLREEARQKRKGERKAAPWAEENGGRTPELDETENGGPPPELTDGTAEQERGTAPQPRTGDRPPNGSGGRPPYTPGGYPWGSHDGAEVGFQPQVVGGSGEQADSHEHDHDTAASDDPDTWRRCRVCNRPILPDPKRPGRTVHARCEPALATTDHGRHTA
ncbi:hypothetical protein [Streptomyces flaveolus]|uniref:hypothetical protein n=1 Tax=Streptomyces flaveolus TaxID=67297 RepID=UPI003420FE6A